MIRVVTDSTSSIPATMREELGIETVTLFVNRDGREYAEADIDLDAFYQDIYDMLDDIPTSSQPSLAALVDAFERAAIAGDEVLGVFLSSRMSGTFENALRAARSVQARYPKFTYSIIDSTSNCFDLGWAVVAAVEARDKGCSLEECAEATVEAVASSRFIFAPESLTFLQKGGRIGKASALLGNIISLSPILTVSDGEATTFAKVRTQKKALAKIVAKLREDADAYGLKDVVVHYIGKREPAVEWARKAIDPILGHEALVVPASPVIGLHVGPSMGVAYRCNAPLPGKLDKVRPEVVSSCSSASLMTQASMLLSQLQERVEEHVEGVQGRLPDLQKSLSNLPKSLSDLPDIPKPDLPKSLSDLPKPKNLPDLPDLQKNLSDLQELSDKLGDVAHRFRK